MHVSRPPGDVAKRWRLERASIGVACPREQLSLCYEVTPFVGERLRRRIPADPQVVEGPVGEERTVVAPIAACPTRSLVMRASPNASLKYGA